MEFEIPQDIAGLSDDDLDAAILKAKEVAASYDDIADADLTDEQVRAIVALSEFVVSAQEIQGTRATVAAEKAAERTAQVLEARKALAPVAEEEPVEAAAEVVEEPVAVAAAARPRSVVARAAAVAPKAVVTPPKAGAVLLASADIPGITTGSRLVDLSAVGDAAIAKMKTFPTGRVGGEAGTQIRGGVARIEKAAGRADRVVASDYEDGIAALNAAAREYRLPGGSLVAAGGWCAPSDTLYDLCDLASTDGIISLPELSVDRGGIRYMKKPDFAAIYNSVGFHLTEAQVISGTAKTCIEVDCPTWEEARLDAYGLCIKAGILTNSAFPEYVRYFIETALIAHQHKMAAGFITQMLTASSALSVGSLTTAADSLTEADLAAVYIRQIHRMSDSATLEMVAPAWYKSVIRADLGRRWGVETLSVSDQQITGYFAERGVAVQWVHNMHDLTATAGVVAIPETVDLLIYPAGTWVKGTTDVITLDAIYDSTNILTNTYTALFAEEGAFLVERCFESYKITVPTCASGQVGAADLTDCVVGGVVTP